MNNKLKELEEIVKAFCEERDWDQYHSPKDLAIGISTEANELLDIFRFKNKVEQIKIIKSYKIENIKDEMADIFFFLLRFAQLYGVNLEEALKNKINKNNKKYPVEKAKNSNKKYSEF